MWASAFDLAPNLEEGGHGAEVAEHAADADRVGDGLMQAVGFGDCDIWAVGFVGVADGEGGDDVVGAFEGSLAVGGDGEVCADAEVADHARRQWADQVEAPLVDVHEGDVAAREFGPREDVGDQAAGEGGASGADQGDLWAAVGHRATSRWAGNIGLGVPGAGGIVSATVARASWVAQVFGESGAPTLPLGRAQRQPVIHRFDERRARMLADHIREAGTDARGPHTRGGHGCSRTTYERRARMPADHVGAAR